MNGMVERRIKRAVLSTGSIGIQLGRWGQPDLRDYNTKPSETLIKFRPRKSVYHGLHKKNL